MLGTFKVFYLIVIMILEIEMYITHYYDIKFKQCVSLRNVTASQKARGDKDFSTQPTKEHSLFTVGHGLLRSFTLVKHPQIFSYLFSTVCADVKTFCMKYVWWRCLYFISMDKTF
jgi:hypothetical protein